MGDAVLLLIIIAVMSALFVGGTLIAEAIERMGR